ncbi:hypothetical protein BDR07DRAFT_1466595 [Suillus spraguei]|nr:hypothetical protein BDR07DRAFT_1466595 [Suillus spraguei]
MTSTTASEATERGMRASATQRKLMSTTTTIASEATRRETRESATPMTLMPMTLAIPSKTTGRGVRKSASRTKLTPVTPPMSSLITRTSWLDTTQVWHPRSLTYKLFHCTSIYHDLFIWLLPYYVPM